MLRTCLTGAHFFLDEGVYEEKLKLYRDAGIKCIDFSLDLQLPPDKIKSGEFSPFFEKSIEKMIEYYTPYKKKLEEYGIEATQAHAPFQLYVYGNDEINNKCYDVLEKCLATCDFLNCRLLVVHPVNIAYEYGIEEERRVNIEYYKKMIPMAKKYNVKILLENMFSSRNRHVYEAVCSDMHDVIYYIDTLNDMAGEEVFGYCFDLGHATLVGKNVKECLKLLGNRIKALHIHDNDGIEDDHMMPYTFVRGWGNCHVTDWEGFIEGLKEINYRGELDFEIIHTFHMVPPPVVPYTLQYIRGVGEYFKSRILGE